MTQTVADKLRSHPDLAGYAATERGHRFLSDRLAEQRDNRAGFSDIKEKAEQRIKRDQDIIRQADEGIERSVDAINVNVLERVLGGNLAA